MGSSRYDRAWEDDAEELGLEEPLLIPSPLQLCSGEQLLVPLEPLEPLMLFSVTPKVPLVVAGGEAGSIAMGAIVKRPSRVQETLRSRVETESNTSMNCWR